jgi:hypothetical protein
MIDLERDLVILLEAGLGPAIIPGSISSPSTPSGSSINGIDLGRAIFV